ncbi:hypothetical protein CKO21_00590 [Rhodovibrio salinarum]|uniref:Lipoprotein n=1 Tax=Rhodovibrio salinarum TaxID=1087 RepID=A0A934UXQ9_9PROT|nr:hypothetical protein [Rhodovibrio salinarum]
MRVRFAGLFIAIGLAFAACGAVPPAAPYDPIIQDTATKFDRAFQTFVIKLNRTAGTPAGAYASHQDFYDTWRGELAHLRNRAVATDPADACPLSGATAEAFADLAQTSGALGGQALGAGGDLAELIEVALSRVAARLDALSAELNQPPGTLTPSQIETLRAKRAAWTAKRARLQGVANAMAVSQVSAPEGGCSTIVVAKLDQQFTDFERFHQAQGAIGVPARAQAPVILMNVTIQNVLKVQAVKQQKAAAGLL